MRIGIIALLVSLNLSGCSAKRGIPSADPQTAPDIESGILFLSLNVKEDSLGTTTITLLNQNWVAGSFKEIGRQPSNNNNALEFTFLDSHQRVLKKVSVEHPLKTSVEAVSSNGTLERKKVNLKEAALNIRTNVQRSLTHITVSDSKGQIGLIQL